VLPLPQEVRASNRVGAAFSTKSVIASRRYDLAETDLTHAIAADPHNIDFLVNRSQCYYETREFDAAVCCTSLGILFFFG
jgi:tyrosine-protein phosphatase YwqE